MYWSVNLLIVHWNILLFFMHYPYIGRQWTDSTCVNLHVRTLVQLDMCYFYIDSPFVHAPTLMFGILRHALSE